MQDAIRSSGAFLLISSIVNFNLYKMQLEEYWSRKTTYSTTNFNLYKMQLEVIPTKPDFNSMMHFNLYKMQLEVPNIGLLSPENPISISTRCN